jgi:hypothetical protein
MPTRAVEALKLIKGILNACVIGLRAGFWSGSKSMGAEKMM